MLSKCSDGVVSIDVPIYIWCSDVCRCVVAALVGREGRDGFDTKMLQKQRQGASVGHRGTPGVFLLISKIAWWQGLSLYSSELSALR